MTIGTNHGHTMCMFGYLWKLASKENAWQACLRLAKDRADFRRRIHFWIKRLELRRSTLATSDADSDFHFRKAVTLIIPDATCLNSLSVPTYSVALAGSPIYRSGLSTLNYPKTVTLLIVSLL